MWRPLGGAGVLFRRQKSHSPGALTEQWAGMCGGEAVGGMTRVWWCCCVMSLSPLRLFVAWRTRSVHGVLVPPSEFELLCSCSGALAGCVIDVQAPRKVALGVCMKYKQSHVATITG